MKETALILTELHPQGRTEPDREALEKIVTAWLRRELEKEDAIYPPAEKRE